MNKHLLLILLGFVSLSAVASEEILTLECKHIKTDFYDSKNNIKETKRNLSPKSIILDLEQKTVTTGQGKRTFEERSIEVVWQYKDEMPKTEKFKAVTWYYNHSLDRVSGSYEIREAFCIEGRSQCSRQDDEYYTCSKKEELF